MTTRPAHKNTIPYERMHEESYRTDILFWNVDTEVDFMLKELRTGKETWQGRLYVQDAETIIPQLGYITTLAEEEGIRTANSKDRHNKRSPEISDNPDYVNTFPMHCEENTPGEWFIAATRPQDAYEIDYRDETFSPTEVMRHRNVVITKDQFDVFHPTGAPHTQAIVDLYKQHGLKKAVVYGVASNVCDDYAVMGLLRNGLEVYVVTDAIKELPNIPIEPVLRKWEDAGARFITTDTLEDIIR